MTPPADDARAIGAMQANIEALRREIEAARDDQRSAHGEMRQALRSLEHRADGHDQAIEVGKAVAKVVGVLSAFALFVGQTWEGFFAWLRGIILR